MIKQILEALQNDSLLIGTSHLDEGMALQGKVQTDNRLIKSGDIFVCIKGESFDGHNFVNQAVASGASIIVCQQKPLGQHAAIWVKDTRKAAAVIARCVLLPKVLPYCLIGITGTNGKTTTSLMLYEALRNLGKSCGWIGTLGYYINGVQYPTMHTTPDIIQLNEIFARMAAEGAQYIVMEVSSHALSLDRVYGVRFDYCLFSNLSRDHLDFHGDMKSYGEVKYKLFDRGIADKSTAIVNTDDKFGAEIYSRLASAGAVCHSVGNDNADYRVQEAIMEVNHTSFALAHSTKTINIESKLIGSFNVANLALTAATLCTIGFEARSISRALAEIPPVTGRIERIDNPHGIGVFVDYAHTPDAVENLLKAVMDLPHKRILCLIGAGGGRDKGKRPLMLKAALKYSDAVIVTDDNPRFENPDAIIRDIVVDSDPRLPWWVIRDRKEAISSIINLAQPGDIVLLCGKGHESYQEIEGIRHQFRDHEVAAKALSGWTNAPQKDDDELILPIDQTLVNLLFDAQWTPEEKGYKHPKGFRYLSTDSRNIKPGSLFVAIKGEKFDGHNYLTEVLSQPLNHAIVDKPHSVETNVTHTRESVKAMGLLCGKYLQMFPAKRVALTGSTGKTSTKELIAQVLGANTSFLKTLANENNLIGVCKTILRVLPDHQYAIFELGTNHFGEIAAMADVVSPDYALIVNIGPSHLEFLGDEDGVYKEKSDLFKRPLALRLYPGDDDRFEAFASSGIGVGFADNCRYKIDNHIMSPESQSFDMADHTWVLPYNAPHFAINAAFAIALGLELGIPKIEIQKALSAPIELNMRLQLQPRGEGQLIVDCYNANPCSMQKALEYWQQIMPDKPHIAILGDMLELGESSQMFHRMISAMLAEMNFSTLITVGDYAKLYHQPEESTTNHFATATDLLVSEQIKHIPNDAVVLLKASHGIHLELLIPILQGDR